MAKRPVFTCIEKSPFVRRDMVEFEYFGGFSQAQKRRCIDSLQGAYGMIYPDVRLLEISSKSELELGVQLSAFNLTLPNSHKGMEHVTVECAFQASKVFQNGGPFIDLMFGTSREAKKNERIRNSGALIGFTCLGTEFPTEPKTLFYNWLYIKALSLHPEYFEGVEQFGGFTDIEFNPQKSINCQAEAAAIFVGLKKKNLVEEALSSISSFEHLVYGIESKEKDMKNEFEQCFLEDFFS